MVKFAEMDLDSDEEKVETKVKVVKKRKTPDSNEEKNTLLHAARGVTPTTDEWSKVRKYNISKLRDYVELRRFERDRAVGEGMIGRGVQLAAKMFDKLLKADGHVEREIVTDQALLECVQSELGDIIKFLNNKVKILFLLGNDTLSGLAKKPRVESASIEEEREDADTSSKEAAQCGAIVDEVHPDVHPNQDGPEAEGQDLEPGGCVEEEEDRSPVAALREDRRAVPSPGAERSWEDDFDVEIAEGTAQGDFRPDLDSEPNCRAAARLRQSPPRRHQDH